MNNLSPTSAINVEKAKPGGYRDASSSIEHRPPVTTCNDRLAELEIENSRLHRLVAELLIKNQQLRKPD
jgi:hypothetical protein